MAPGRLQLRLGSQSQNLFGLSGGFHPLAKARGRRLNATHGSTRHFFRPDHRTSIRLHEAGFVYRTRVRVEEDGEGNVVKRQIVQLWFAYREQLNVAARFCSDFLLVIDGTFNTNKERLPLLIAVGVLNSGHTFPVCFSYCPSESEESFMFVFESLREECFKSKLHLPAPPPPRVILGNQAAGLIAAVPKAFPDCQIQHCSGMRLKQ